MDPQVQEEIQVLLDLLKSSLITNRVSMATDDKGNILFFDTEAYLRDKTMSGFRVNINDLVGGA